MVEGWASTVRTSASSMEKITTKQASPSSWMTRAAAAVRVELPFGGELSQPAPFVIRMLGG